MANFRELLNRLKEKYPTAVDRGKEFEKICKWFLENDPTYADNFKNIWLWYDWPDREKNGFGQDIGIDLVGETHTGKLWAIQAKCYIGTEISTDEITSFLSFSGNKIFTNRLLICTGEISKNGMVHINNQDKPVQTLFNSDLNKSPVNWFDYYPSKTSKTIQYKSDLDDSIAYYNQGFKY
jgi:predicted helicase